MTPDTERKTSVEERVASLASDKQAVYLGTVVTAVGTVLFFVLPEIVTRTTQVEVPLLTYLRWWGGTVGGAVAGWRTSDQSAGFVTGLKAAVYGLLLAYLLSIVLYYLYGAIVIGVFPVSGLPLVAVMFYYAIPLLFAHLAGGVVAGWAAQRFRERGA